jgi:hypothetical protein
VLDASERYIRKLGPVVPVDRGRGQ